MECFTIRGARGTTPACGAGFLKYGGNTTCFSVRADGGLLIIDAGTGISSVGAEIAASGTPTDIVLLFTHFHMDHVFGLPTFSPLYDRNTQITIMGDPRRAGGWQRSLKDFIAKPYWPVGLGESDAVMRLADLPVEKGRLERFGLSVTWFDLPHPQRCLAYRVTMPRTTIVVATDVEYAAGAIDPAFVDFCRGADYLLFDAHYLPGEYAAHRGWGHSTWQAAVEAARKASVGTLVLTHHAPERTDNELDAIVAEASGHFTNVRAASENAVLA